MIDILICILIIYTTIVLVNYSTLLAELQDNGLEFILDDKSYKKEVYTILIPIPLIPVNMTINNIRSKKYIKTRKSEFSSLNIAKFDTWCKQYKYGTYYKYLYIIACKEIHDDFYDMRNYIAKVYVLLENDLSKFKETFSVFEEYIEIKYNKIINKNIQHEVIYTDDNNETILTILHNNISNIRNSLK